MKTILSTLLLAVASPALAQSGAISGGGSRLPTEVMCEFEAEGDRFYGFDVLMPPYGFGGRDTTAAFSKAEPLGMVWSDFFDAVRTLRAQQDGPEVFYSDGRERGLRIAVDFDRKATPAEIGALKNLPRLEPASTCYYAATASYPRRGVAATRGFCVFELYAPWLGCN